MLVLSFVWDVEGLLLAEALLSFSLLTGFLSVDVVGNLSMGFAEELLLVGLISSFFF